MPWQCAEISSMPEAGSDQYVVSFIYGQIRVQALACFGPGSLFWVNHDGQTLGLPWDLEGLGWLVIPKWDGCK